MNNTVKALLFALSLLPMSFNAYAKEERTAETSCDERVPRIEIIDALRIAFDEAKKLNVSASSFIDAMTLECIEMKQVWIVGFRQREHETGHFLVYIHMDGTTKTAMVKDG